MTGVLCALIIAHGALLGFAITDIRQVDTRLLWALAVTGIAIAALALVLNLELIACLAAGATGAYLAFLPPGGRRWSRPS